MELSVFSLPAAFVDGHDLARFQTFRHVDDPLVAASPEGDLQALLLLQEGAVDENVDGGKLFPKPDLDLGEVYYGLDYTMPTEEQAQKLIDNCSSITHRNSSGDEYIVVGNESESGSLRFPKPQAPGEQLGFWLADGSALIYSYGEDKTIEGDFICTLSILPSSATASREFAVRPVLKQ